MSPRQRLAAALLCLCAALACAPARGWGARASADDLFEMNADYARLYMLFGAVKFPAEAVERLRRRLLAGEPDEASDLDIGAWMNVAGAATVRLIERHGVRIIRNPSASCSVAVSVFGLLFNVERQAAMLGTSIFPESGPDEPSLVILPPLEPDETRDLSKLTPLSRIANEVLTRCIEDAYDQCVESGSHWPFIELASALARQLALLGLSESDMVSRVHPRMRDCAVYELKVAAEQSSQVVYLGPAAYTSEIRDIARRGRLRLFTPYPVTSVVALATSRLYSPAIQPEILPTLTCTGQHGERCRWKPVDEAPADVATILLQEFRVKHKFLRAIVRAKPSPHPMIEFEEFTPESMRQNSLALHYISKPGLYIEVIRPDGRLIRTDSFLLIDRLLERIVDWERHDVALASIVFSKKVDQEYNSTRGSVLSRKIHETITYTLKHVPEERGQPPDSVPPPLPDRRPAVPAPR